MTWFERTSEVGRLAAQVEAQRAELLALTAALEERNAQWDLVTEQITYLCNLIVTVSGMMQARDAPRSDAPVIILTHQPHIDS